MRPVGLEEKHRVRLTRDIHHDVQQAHPDVAFHVEPETDANILVRRGEPGCREDGILAFDRGTAGLKVNVVALGCG